MKGVLIFLGFLAVAAGYPSAESRIVGGTAVGQAVPFVVSIQENDAHLCGGFIYNDKTVITAASCVEGKGPAALKVSINDYKFISSTDSKEEKVAVFKIIIHEDYVNGDHAYDIAVVELATTLKLVSLTADYETSDPFTGPSCINYDEVLNTYTDGTIYGWGLSEADGPISTTLKKTQVLLKSSKDCLEGGEVALTGFNPSTMICTSNGDSPADATTAPCDTDEGAPLVVIDETDQTKKLPIVVGIYTFNGGNCDPTKANVFTRLSVFYAWLARNAGSQPDCLNIPSAISNAL